MLSRTAADTTLALDRWHAALGPIARLVDDLDANGINADSVRQDIEKEIKAGTVKTWDRVRFSHTS